MTRAYFVTGTDTHVGKTWATVALMRYFIAHGKTVVGMKPVASGCDMQEGRLKNSDALLLQQQSNLVLDYQHINPFAYASAVSPHIAGKHQPADFKVIQTYFHQLTALADVVMVEGAGGWHSPLTPEADNASLATLLDLPIIMVVAIRLGCINHARLTLEAIQHAQQYCCGWMAVCNDPTMQHVQDNIDYLQHALSVPLLGVLPYRVKADFDQFAAGINFSVAEVGM